MQEDSSRRRFLAAGALGAIASVGGCLRLSDGEDTTASSTTETDAGTDEPTSTTGGTEREETCHIYALH